MTTKAKSTRADRNALEIEFMQLLILALGAQPWCRCWRQNTGQVEVRDARGAVRGIFRAGPPTGAADVSGLVAGGRRLEIECKAADGARSVEQERWAAMVARFGGLYLLAQLRDAEPVAEGVRRTVADVARAAGAEVDAAALARALRGTA